MISMERELIRGGAGLSWGDKHVNRFRVLNRWVVCLD